jgi:hypothetical protein
MDLVKAGTVNSVAQMLTRVVIAIFVALAFIPSVNLKANAQEYTGMDLIQDCTSTGQDRRAFCLGYLRGFLNGVMAGQQAFQLGYVVCQPSGVSPPQLSLMVQKMARENPAVLNQSALDITDRTILDAFRCTPGQRPNYGHLKP